MEFKIYDELKKAIELEGIDWNNELDSEFRATINRLSLEHRKIIYAIILHHARINGNNASIPYRGKKGYGGKGVTFDCKNLPIDCIKILIKYLQTVTK